MKHDENVRTVDAEISYLAPGSYINRRFVAPGVEANTGTYETHPVRIRDGRPIKARFNLDEHGFVLAEHPSAVRDFRDKEQVDAIYPREVRDIVKRLTGADLVSVRGWMVRTSGDLPKNQRKLVGYTHQGGVQPPAAEAHVDYTPSTAERVAGETYASEFHDYAPYSRFICSSLWRTFSPPPQDWPLALCDGSSVGADEGTPNALIVVDELPDRERMLGEWPEEKAITAAVFRRNPNHRWWYFSNMTRDEVVLLKFHDSDKNRACRVPHTAFRDTSLPDVRPRESIEVRTIAYFL